MTPILEYNTERAFIALKEYGRNIQTMVANLNDIADREKRTEQAKDLVELIRNYVQPGLKDNPDIVHKIWDDIYIISNFSLDVDSPFPKPDAAVLFKKPDTLDYGTNKIFFRHYGKNIEMLVSQIIEMPESEEKQDAIIYIGRLMKNFFAQYNKDIVEDVVIRDQLQRLSKGKIILDLDRIRSENLFETNLKFLDKRVQTSTLNESRDRRNNDRNRNNNRGGSPQNNNQKKRRR